MSRQTATLVALAAIATAGVALSGRAWVLLWRQWRARRGAPVHHDGELTAAPPSSRNGETPGQGEP